jgi:hypothetical protein
LANQSSRTVNLNSCGRETARAESQEFRSEGSTQGKHLEAHVRFQRGGARQTARAEKGELAARGVGAIKRRENRAQEAATLSCLSVL